MSTLQQSDIFLSCDDWRSFYFVWHQTLYSLTFLLLSIIEVQTWPRACTASLNARLDLCPCSGTICCCARVATANKNLCSWWQLLPARQFRRMICAFTTCPLFRSAAFTPPALANKRCSQTEATVWQKLTFFETSKRDNDEGLAETYIFTFIRMRAISDGYSNTF